jgi:hypothetical protein
LQHPELSVWVQAVALLQVVDGLDVKLIGNSATEIGQIKAELETASSRIEQLLALPDNVADIGALLGAVNSPAPATDVATANLNSRLIRLTQRITSVLSAVAPLSSQISQLISASQGETAAGTATISNVVVPAYNVAPPGNQATFTLPIGTKRLAVKCRGGANDDLEDIYYSWLPDKVGPQSGDVSGGFDTIPANQSYWEDSLDLKTAKTLYLSARRQVVATISYWR